MLLIDGASYQEWEPPNEQSFEREVIEHSRNIFGANSIYFDKKHGMKSLSGVGSIPDGLALILGDKPEWHIVEMELSSHSVHGHIVSQLSKFLMAIGSQEARAQILRV